MRQLYLTFPMVNLSHCVRNDRMLPFAYRWTAQIQHFYNAGRTQIEIFTDHVYQLIFGNLTCAKGIHHDGGGLCYSDGIRQLYFTSFGRVLLLQCFCRIPGSICRRTVYLGTVFSGKCAAAVACHSSVCVYNNLTSVSPLSP